MACPFRKKCDYYCEDNAACNGVCMMKDDGEYYCGKAREFAEE